MVVMKISPLRLGRPYARLLAWALRRFSRPPYGTVFQVEAEGENDGVAASAGLRLSHPDGYWLTAAAAAACLLQWIDGSLREPGVHLQALAADPARMLRDLVRIGRGRLGAGSGRRRPARRHGGARLIAPVPGERRTTRAWAIVLSLSGPTAPRMAPREIVARTRAAVAQGGTSEDC